MYLHKLPVILINKTLSFAFAATPHNPQIKIFVKTCIVHDIQSRAGLLQSDLAQTKALICCCCIVNGALWPGVCVSQSLT